jgi:UDP-N-acetylglucosamine--N-acetylmuramyl-(pentapeptide) pyrophosphoryl-undecaprenol N-acetylglucosamine transferase
MLVAGGSQGAAAVNRLMTQAVAQWPEAIRRDLQIVHLAGAADLRMMQTAYAAAGVTARVFPFLHRMGDAYAVADLVVARAGASTIAEATSLGLPMLLIPYPHAGGHQRFNAEVVARAGAAVVLEQNGLSGERLARELRRLLDDPAARRGMAEASRRAGYPDAAQRLAEEIVRLAGLGNSAVRAARDGRQDLGAEGELVGAERGEVA